MTHYICGEKNKKRVQMFACLLLTACALIPLRCMVRRAVEPMYLTMLWTCAGRPFEDLRVFSCGEDGGYSVVGILPGVTSAARTVLDGERIYWIEYDEQDGNHRRALVSLNLQSGERGIVHESAELQTLSIRPYGMKAIDGWVYFTVYADIDGRSSGELYRASQKGLERVALNIHPLWEFTSDGTWIYYADYEPGQPTQLCRIKLDGSERDVIGELYGGNNKYQRELFYAEGRVYYVDTTFTLRSISLTDGSGRVELAGVDGGIAIGGGRIFYLKRQAQSAVDFTGRCTLYTLCARSLEGEQSIEYGPVNWDGWSSLLGYLHFGTRGFVVNVADMFHEDIRQRNNYAYFPYTGGPPQVLELKHWE